MGDYRSIIACVQCMKQKNKQKAKTISNMGKNCLGLVFVVNMQKTVGYEAVRMI